MTQEEHVQYWLDTAAQDWDGSQVLMANALQPAVVLAHWTLEKLSKALWVQQHPDAMPPVTNDVALLLAATSFVIDKEQTTFAQNLKAFHDDVLEPDPRHPVPIPDLIIISTQAGAMREQLLQAIRGC